MKRSIAIALLAGVVAGTVYSFLSGGLVAVLLDARLPADDKVRALQAFFEAWGPAAPLVYVAVVTIEVVVAPIPGTMLYLPGGVIFGGFIGGTLSLLGNVLGAGLSCQLMRTLAGRAWLTRFIESPKLSRYQQLIDRHGVLIVALLRVNPLTSSDLVSYASGLTPMRPLAVMAGTCVGMAPLCFLQAFLAQELFTMFPWLIWPLVVACCVYAGVVAWVIHKLGREIEGKIGGQDTD